MFEKFDVIFITIYSVDLLSFLLTCGKCLNVSKLRSVADENVLSKFCLFQWYEVHVNKGKMQKKKKIEEKEGKNPIEKLIMLEATIM